MQRYSWRVWIINCLIIQFPRVKNGTHRGSQVGSMGGEPLAPHNMLTRMSTTKASIVPLKMPDIIL